MSREVKENKLESKYKSIILSRNKIEKKKRNEEETTKAIFDMQIRTFSKRLL